MPQSQDISEWAARLQQCSSRQEVFALLDQFRRLDWTDEQRSAMSRAYMRVIGALSPAADETGPATSDKANDGPTWYEKM